MFTETKNEYKLIQNTMKNTNTNKQIIDTLRENDSHIRIPLAEFSLLYRCFLTLDGLIEYSGKDKETFEFMVDAKIKTGTKLCKEYLANYERN